MNQFPFLISFVNKNVQKQKKPAQGRRSDHERYYLLEITWPHCVEKILPNFLIKWCIIREIPLILFYQVGHFLQNVGISKIRLNHL